MVLSRENRNYGLSVGHGLVNLLSEHFQSSSMWSVVLGDNTSIYSLVLKRSITTEERCDDAFVGQKHARLEVETCENLETLCSVFQRICNYTIADLCSKFKELCYKRYHRDYEDELLLKMINTELIYNEQGDYPDYVDNLDKCHCLTSMGPTMVGFCFSITETCQHFAEGRRSSCQFLEKYLGEFFSEEKLYITGYDQKVPRNNCSFLGACQYYLLQCFNQVIKDDLQFMEKVDVDDCKSVFENFNLTWYFSGKRENGILCPHKDPYPISLLIYASSLRASSPLKERCKNSKCTDEYDNIDTEVNKMSINLNAMFKELGLSSSEGVWAILWNSTANKITKPQCIMLTEEYFYLKRLCSCIKDICVNLRALCYTVGTKRSNLNSFWKKLKELPSLDLNVFNFEDKSTSWSSTDLVWSFNYTDGNRTLTECAYYFSECNSLSGIFSNLTHNCTTLRETSLNGYKPKKPTLIKLI
ncbi:hypothetical protein PMAC_003202 [Pneumocystis sp. 'macacae']|nr:hypothetical protein PMAC_003202 [Pneumocystis sp. 'macacae']